MAIEIEKKYRLSKKQRDVVRLRLPEIGAELQGVRFEENTIYSGEALDPARCVLRLRRIDNHAILTYKERFPSRSEIKHQREDETRVEDPDAMELILDALDFTPALVYEKRRESWRLGATKIELDELPFGLFLEVEASEQEIHEFENKLGMKGLKAELATYPQLALKHGVDCSGVIESRFASR